MVLDITNNKRIDAELLERIVAEVEIRASHTTPDMMDEDNCSTEVGKSRETEHLVEFLGKVLQQV